MIISMIRFLRKATVEELDGIALVRLDFNSEGEYRLRTALPTLALLSRRARAVVIMSHKGRPLGPQKKFSLEDNVEHFSELIGKNIEFIRDFNFEEIRRRVKAAPRGSVFALENLRFLPMEKKNDAGLAKNLASLGDYYINDAFPVSHRANASVVAITKLLPAYAGFGLEAELENLGRVMKNPKKPLVIVFGGAKMEDKLPIMLAFKKKADTFLVGGALANTLLKLKGVNIKKSVSEKTITPEIRSILRLKQVELPIDYEWDGARILDIGGKTMHRFAARIREAKTIVWNGPMGLIEKEKFKKGTTAVARAIAANKTAFSVIGGGETVVAAEDAGVLEKVGFVSTGGGAMLEFLAGKKLPGIEALKHAKK